MNLHNTVFDTPSTERRGSPFFYSQHARLLNLAHHELGYNRSEVMGLQSALVQWWENDRMPFPSEALIAARERVTERTVRRWKSKAKKLGHLRLIPRYERGRRTSDTWDFSGLIEALDQYAETHPNPYEKPVLAPKPPRAKRTKMSGIEGKLTGHECPTKYQKPMIMISPSETPSPPEDHDPVELPLAVNAKCEPGNTAGVESVGINRSDDPGEEAAVQAPQLGARSPARTPEPARNPEPEEMPSPEPRPTLVERRAKAEQIVAGAKAKTERAHRQRVAKAASQPSYAERKAQAQKDAATGPKAQLKANVNIVNTAWKEAMAEYHPESPKEKALSIPHRQILINLIEAWGEEDAAKLMWFTAKHWGALRSQFKNRLDDNPTLGFIQLFSQKFMQQMKLLEKYEALLAKQDNTDFYGPNSGNYELNGMFNRLKELHLK